MTMEDLQHPIGRGISYLLIYLTAIHPLHPTIAASITPANTNTQVQAGNVPVVNIAQPNTAGVSHNLYQDFNVGVSGVVLNNATTTGVSQSAGQINANVNLNGKAADLIINEVTGSNRSVLEGKLEVFGNKANVMIANANGITCDGCGFINTPGITLTTGKPQFDQQGALAALEVKTGVISIGDKGLDATAQDYVDIISRATELNGNISAQNLALTQGSNRVNFADGTITSLASDDAKPQLAIDTKALGGMYANKIRLVASEEGVGVNLKNLTTTQQGITLSANGKIQLGNTNANGDLNISAKYVDIPHSVTVKSGSDITVASPHLNNRGDLNAGQDMRLFADNLTNTQATIQANNNLWIQKDALGNKSTRVENRSGTVKTQNGDLVIRTAALDNVRDKWVITEKEITPNASSMNANVGFMLLPSPSPSIPPIPMVFEGVFDSSLPKEWFGHISLYQDKHLLILKQQQKISESSNSAEINSGNHLYINANTLTNNESLITASKNAFITGENLYHRSTAETDTNTYNSIKLNQPIPFHEYLSKENIEAIKKIPYPFLGKVTKIKFTLDKKEQESSITQITPGVISAKKNLVLDFTDTITTNHTRSLDRKDADQITFNVETPNTLSADNIVLHAKSINVEGKINAENDLSLIAENSINLLHAKLTVKNTLSALAANNINAKQSTLSGKNIALHAREGNINIYTDDHIKNYTADGARQFSQLNASENLSLQSGKDIILSGIDIAKNQNSTFLAGNNLTFNMNDVLLQSEKTGVSSTDIDKQQYFNDTLKKQGVLSSSGDITLNAGNTLNIAGSTIHANNNIHLAAGMDINLNPRVLTDIPDRLFAPSRQPELSTTVTAGNQLLISSGKDLLAQSAKLTSKGNATLLAGDNLKLLSTAYSAIDSKNDNNKDDRHVVAQVEAGKNLTLVANGELLTYGTTLTSANDMQLSSNGKMEFNAVANHIYREGHKEYSESVQQQNTTLNSGGLLTLLSNSSILFQATQLTAKSTLDAAAKGGFLYAQAMENVSHYEKTKTKRKWYGQKTTIRQTRHDVANKVTAFSAGGDINLLSRDDSTYEASKINAGKNATLTSTKGKVNFKAAKDSAFEQTVATSKGFFIKSSDKGYTKDTWQLPTIHTGGQLTVEADQGITADIKARNAQSLQNALLTLGSTPGTSWLSNLNTRDDVQWNQVQDAFSSWHHTHQSLNPVVGAVIAIAVAAATAGSGLAAYGADLAAGTVGSTSAAVTSATYGAAYSGITALTSQAAVALIDNQGNISKTLQTLSSSNAVKSLVTSMVIGGALAGFDNVMGFDKAAGGTTAATPGNAKLPLLKNSDWSKIAQRVAGQSVISSSLNTAINGGNFGDNFTAALLANVGNQVQAEGAHLIGNNGAILDIPGKAVSHAVLAGVTAEIGGGNAKGAAAGALAAELAGVIINDNLVKTENWQEQQAQISRVTGAIAGAIATGKAEGANSGASAGEVVERFNRQLHMNEIEAIKKLAGGDKEKEARLLAASCRKVNCTSQESLNSEDRQQYETLMNQYPATRDEDALLANYWMQKERQRTSNYPAFTGYEVEQLFTYTQGDQISDSQLFARNQWVENLQGMTGWSKNTAEAFGFSVSIASTFAGMGKANIGNQYLSTQLVAPTAGWKSYLVNERTIEQAAAFRSQVVELRSGLPSDYKRGGNMAVAEINIPGMPKTMAAHSRINDAGKGLVGKGSQNYEFQKIPNAKGDMIPRNTDSEYKILDNLSDKLAGNTNIKGTVTIFTERPACGSCLGVVEQFQQKYPGVNIGVIDNNGVILKPGAKK